MEYIIGVVLGFGLMLYGIIVGADAADPVIYEGTLGVLMRFVDYPSIYITIGGTIACVIAAFPFSILKRIPSHMKVVVGKNKYKPMFYIDTIIEFATDARKQGLLVLEDKATTLKDPFFKNGVMLIVDAVEEDKVRAILEGEINSITDRHDTATNVYLKGAGYAPAFGMIGTLIGLVNMLASMGDMAAGAAGISTGMAVALLTTLYGSIIANLILAPIANKLGVRHAEEMLCKDIILEGIMSIQSGENPKNIKEKLLTNLEAGLRDGKKGKKGKKGPKGPKEPKAPKEPKK